MKNPFDEPKFMRWANVMRKELIPKMAGSHHIMMIAPKTTDTFDIEFALQIGASILLDKPLVLLVADDREPPPRLAKIADRIIRADVTTEAGQKAAQDEIRKFIKESERNGRNDS